MAQDREILIQKYPKHFTPAYQWTEEEREMAKNMLFDTQKIFDKVDVIFWLMYGTLLGIYRENRLLPWDGDIDIGIYVKDFEKVLSLNDEFHNLGYESLSVCSPGKGMIIICKNGIHIDVSCLEKFSGNKVFWSNFYYPKDDFDKENYIMWEDHMWRIPYNPVKHLTYTYGKDWNIPIKGLVIPGPMGSDYLV